MNFNMISIYFNMILYYDCIWIPILISSASLWNWHWGPWRRWTLWKWRVFLVCSSWWLATQPQELSTSWASWWRMSVWLKFCGTHPQSSCHSTFHHLSLHRILELQHHTFHLLVIQDEAFACDRMIQDDCPCSLSKALERKGRCNMLKANESKQNKSWNNTAELQHVNPICFTFPSDSDIILLGHAFGLSQTTSLSSIYKLCGSMIAGTKFSTTQPNLSAGGC